MTLFRTVRQLFLALAVVLTGVVLVAAPASAHVGNIHASGSCVDSQTASVTYTVGWSNGTATGKLYQRSGLYGQTGNAGSSTAGWTFVKNVSGAAGTETFTLNHAKSTFSGTNAANGPWWSSKVVFSDNYGVAADTRVEGFDWSNCSRDASFTKSISQPTCNTGAVLTYSGSNVTFTGPASGLTGPKTAAQATVTALPVAGHQWTDGGSTARTVNNAALAGPLGADHDSCAAKDAAAGVNVIDPVCGSAGSAVVNGVQHATLTSNGGVLAQGVGPHTATFTADPNHRFADGSKTKTVTYTIAGPIDPDSDQCAGQDAAANVSVTDPTCNSAGAAQVTGLSFATLTSNGGVLDQTVGPHTATFTSAANHRFPGGSKTKDVPYTIAGPISADSDECAVKDSAAGVDVTDPTCNSAGTATVTGLSFATLTSNGGVLDQTVGPHTATFTSAVNHRFPGGSKTKDVPYTIAGPISADSDECAVKNAAAGVSVSEPGLQLGRRRVGHGSQSSRR